MTSHRLQKLHKFRKRKYNAEFLFFTNNQTWLWKINIQHMQNTYIFHVHSSELFMLLENVLKHIHKKM